jgi:anthranilate synthase component 1
MLVDLGRNDLGRVSRAGTVTVSKYLEVERYSARPPPRVARRGPLRPELDASTRCGPSFPAGTLSGAPKVRAMQLIAAAEGERRGLYGGAVGYLGYDGPRTAITIRARSSARARTKSIPAAGIRRRKRAREGSYDETEHKAAALRRAIELAVAPADARGPGRARARRLGRRGEAPDDP